MSSDSPPLGRYSSRPLPPYRYRPGESPHPTRDSAGHAYGAPEVPVAFDPERWACCTSYLFAIDLFNEGYYWEAHEDLEGLWNAAGRDTEVGRLLRGLIQLAASLLKQAIGEEAGALRLALRGGRVCREQTGPRLGIDWARLVDEVEARVEGRRAAAPSIRLIGLPQEPSRDPETPKRGRP